MTDAERLRIAVRLIRVLLRKVVQRRPLTDAEKDDVVAMTSRELNVIAPRTHRNVKEE